MTLFLHRNQRKRHDDIQSRTLTFQKIFCICFNESPLKMMKNDFYFILKALVILKIFKFLSWRFGHAEKTT